MLCTGPHTLLSSPEWWALYVPRGALKPDRAHVCLTARSAPSIALVCAYIRLLTRANALLNVGVTIGVPGALLQRDGSAGHRLVGKECHQREETTDLDPVA